MNHIYRLVWSGRHGQLVAVSEAARAGGKAGPTSAGVVGALLAGALLAAGAQAGVVATLPGGGQVSAGLAHISQDANTLTVRQETARAAINWQTFSIGANATVNFLQPDAAAVILNRVVGNEQSLISGALNANGQVFLLNANGVLFSGAARVNVGGLVASTLTMSDADFMAGRTLFSGHGGASVINFGALNAADGGYVALLGQQVKNQGSITARLGSAILAAGGRISLNFNGDSLLGVTVDEGSLNALVENHQAIRADGGLVVLSARAVDNLLAGVVNNTGEVRAQSVLERAGKIYFLGQGGAVEVGGTLDASAPNGGRGGFIETSGPRVKVADGAAISTRAARGAQGVWLIDPVDYTIAASGGDMSGAALSSALAGSSVVIQSSGGGSGVAGDINVNDAVSWSSNNTLTLSAYRNINVNRALTASGALGKLALEFGQGSPNSGNPATLSLGLAAGGFAGQINLQAGNNFTTKLGSDGATMAYTVLTGLGAAGSTTSLDLQGVNGNLGGNYVLGADLDASASLGAGFTPLGDGGTPFSGLFNGLGHTISNLTVAQPGRDFVGLFGKNTGHISNLILDTVSATGMANVGGLVGYQTGAGVISNAAVLHGAVTGHANVGSLIGQMDGGTLAGSYASGSVSGDLGGSVEIGGLIGFWNNPPGMSISNSYYNLGATTVSVNGVDKSSQVTVGGLYSPQFTAWIGAGRQAFANPAAYFTLDGSDGSYLLSSANDLKNLLAFADSGTLTFKLGADIDVAAVPGWHLPWLSAALKGNNHALSNLDDDQSYNSLQGLVGFLTASIDHLTVGGMVKGNQSVGGMAGFTRAAISDSVCQVDVTGQNAYVGGLVGFTYNASIVNTTTTGAVSSPGAGGSVGGLIGYAGFTGISNSHASGNVAGAGAVGGLVGGSNGSTINGNSSASGSVTATGSSVGGLVGSSYGSTVSASGASGAVSGDTQVGGLIGWAYSSSIANTTHSGGAVHGNGSVGGLVGTNTGGSQISASNASGAVSGASTVGGLVGDNSAGITGSHASGTVAATGDQAGGLAGLNSTWGGTVTASYASGTVSGRNSVGGLVGRNDNTWTTTNGRPVDASYASGAVTASGTSVGGLVGSWDDPSSITNSHYNVDAVNVTVGGLNQSNQVSLGGLYGAQYGAWMVGGRVALNPLVYFGAADGGGNYPLATPQNMQDLLAFADNAALAFKMVAEVDVTGLPGWHIPYLAAGFNGASHVLAGLSNNQAYNDYQGLFGYSSAALSGVGVLGSVTGRTYVGGLTGLNSGAISNSYAAATVAGSGQLGGLVGQNGAAGHIVNSYANGAVGGASGSDAVGGLVGANGGAVSLAYAAGQLTCHACSNVGGLAGASGGSIANSFWDVQASGVVSSAGGASGLTTAGMMDVSTFNGAAGWSVSGSGGSNAVWRVYDGMSAPLLRSFLRPYTVTANDGTRAYDGGTLSTFGVSYSAPPDGDVLGVASVAASGKDVGNRTLAVHGLYSSQRGYDIDTVDGSLTITPAILSVSGTSVADKIYDGGNAAAVTMGALSGLIGGESLTVAASAVFDSANAGSRSASVNYALSDGGSGGLAANYLLANTSQSATIGRKALTIAGTTAANKIYDGLASAVIVVGEMSGLVGEETLTASAQGRFDSANAGARTASASYALADGAHGGLAGNYVLADSTGMAATIARKALSVGGSKADDKVYDGNATAAIVVGTLAGLVGEETLAVSAQGTFDAINAGTHTASAVYVLADGAHGGLAGNYTLADSAGLAATIARKALSVGGSKAADKVYDGNATAAIVVGTLAGLVGEETLTVSAQGTFDGVNAGPHSAGAVYALADGAHGGLAGNYTLADSRDLLATITPAIVLNNPPPELSNQQSGAIVAAALMPVVASVALPASGVATRSPGLLPAPGANLPFGEGVAVALVSTPGVDEPGVSMTLSQARQLFSAATGERELRVPASRNSLADIVDGGVRLPNGVEQELFVVKAK
ncbi:filamentous hemagglutinin family protein [Oxalobacteraceae bacterium GrIS 1.11]